MEFLKQISVFLLLGQTILHFCPGEKYGKYMKVMLGFMLVVQFAAPLMSLGSKNRMAEYEDNKKAFTLKMEEALQTVDEKWFLYNEQISQQMERELENAEAMVWEQRKKEEEEAARREENGVENTDSNQNKIEVKTVEIEVGAHE